MLNFYSFSGARTEKEAIDERDISIGLADEDHRYVIVRVLLDVHSGGPKCKSSSSFLMSFQCYRLLFKREKSLFFCKGCFLRTNLATTLFWRLFRISCGAFFPLLAQQIKRVRSFCCLFGTLANATWRLVVARFVPRFLRISDVCQGSYAKRDSLLRSFSWYSL